MTRTKMMPFRSQLLPWRRREMEDRPMGSLQQAMNELFDNFDFGPSMFGERSTWDFAPRLDVSETDKEYVVSAELPGVAEKNVHVTVNDDMLTIKGEKNEEREETKRDYFRQERAYGSFCRTIPLPRTVEQDRVVATFKEGVLTVELPKAKEAQTTTRRIPVKPS